ncbi:MAG: DNA repair protein RecO [Calditrichaeota bacterium]|nr:MAG: DNA repair protein RecO [Calditrichota bacterium]
MSLQKTEAVVLKSRRQGETSKILVLYTRAFGKMSLVAKGARSARSRFGGTLEPLNHISLLFYYKETRDLQILSQAEILATFPGIRRDLDKTSIGLAICELVLRLEVAEEGNPLLFRLLLHTLRGIEGCRRDPVNFLRYFQVRLFDLKGFRPELSTCLRCGGPAQENVRFDIVRGGVVCGNCGKQGVSGIPLSLEALHALRTCQQTASAQEIDGLLPSPVAQQQVDHFLDAFLKYHIEGFRDLNALRFYQRIHDQSKEEPRN